MLCPSRQESIRAPAIHQQLHGLRSLFGGMAGFCGEGARGHLQCWGLIPNGQEGRFEDNASVSSERRFEVGSDVRVAIGLEHACTVDARGRVYCWGLSRYGEVGTVGSTSAPVLVSFPGTAVDVAAIASDSCALLSNGEVHCAGSTTRTTGFLGDRTGIRRLIHGFSNICYVDIRGDVDCLVQDGMVQHLRGAAGWDAARGDSLVLAGQFGCVIGPARRRLDCSVLRYELPDSQGHRRAAAWETRSIPLQHPVLFGAAGVQHACFIDTSNAVFCVGSNLYGQLARPGVGPEWRVQPIAFGASHCTRDP